MTKYGNVLSVWVDCTFTLSYAHMRLYIVWWKKISASPLWAKNSTSIWQSKSHLNNVTAYFADAMTLLQISLVYSLHFAEPPRSPVKYFASLMVSYAACSIVLAWLFSPMYLSIITAESNNAVGFALSCPAMSGAVPCTYNNWDYNWSACININIKLIHTNNICTDSNKAPFRPIFPLGVRPSPPTSPAHMSDKISPYRLGITKTSYFPGSCTIFKQTVSKYFSSNLIEGNFWAASRQHLRNKPSDILIIFALCTAVTCKSIIL